MASLEFITGLAAGAGIGLGLNIAGHLRDRGVSYAIIERKRAS